MAIDTDALNASLQRLAGTTALQASITDALSEVATACVDLFAVAGSGIMMADDQNVARYVNASDAPGRILETAESETGQGPCTEAFINSVCVASADVTTEERWPDLAAIVAPHGIRAVLGVPVRIGGITVGTLDVYRNDRHEWDDGERAALLRYSDVVSATLATALAAHTAGRLASQLQYALDYRVIIERGIGYLMARDGLDSVTAFNRLRRTARSTQSKIGEVAQHLIETGELRPPRVE